MNIINITCKDCIYFNEEHDEHNHGCYLHPYKIVNYNDPFCVKFLSKDYINNTKGV